MSGPSYLWGRFTDAHPDIPFSTHIVHLIRDNHIPTLNFQVCASGTLDDNIAGAWSVYPIAKVCLVVLVFFLADFVMMFTLALANVAYEFLMGLVRWVFRFLFVGIPKALSGAGRRTS